MLYGLENIAFPISMIFLCISPYKFITELFYCYFCSKISLEQPCRGNLEEYLQDIFCYNNKTYRLIAIFI